MCGKSCKVSSVLGKKTPHPFIRTVSTLIGWMSCRVRAGPNPCCLLQVHKDTYPHSSPTNPFRWQPNGLFRHMLLWASYRYFQAITSCLNNSHLPKATNLNLSRCIVSLKHLRFVLPQLLSLLTSWAKQTLQNLFVNLLIDQDIMLDLTQSADLSFAHSSCGTPNPVNFQTDLVC